MVISALIAGAEAQAKAKANKMAVLCMSSSFDMKAAPKAAESDTLILTCNQRDVGIGRRLSQNRSERQFGAARVTVARFPYRDSDGKCADVSLWLKLAVNDQSDLGLFFSESGSRRFG
jgi:hypothetical protein